MGNSCSFDSPDLARFAVYSAAAGVSTTVPTFAIAATNAAFLSVSGVFSSTALYGPGLGPCSFSTKASSYVNSDETYTTTALSITPYIRGPDFSTTNCAVIAPSTTDEDFGQTTYTGFSCPNVVLSALPTGTYTLGFVGDDTGDNLRFNTFVITTPLPTTTPTTTLQPVPATTSTQTNFIATTTSTSTLVAEPTSTSIATEITRTVTSTSTTFPGTRTETRTVFTNTIVSTSIIAVGRRATSTFTTYTGTVTSILSTTLTSTTCAARRVTCPRGNAPTTLSCPAADGTCYTTSSGDVYQLECLNRPGNDMSSRATIDAKACMSLCSTTTGCTGAVYRLSNSLCTLKSRSSATTQDPDVIGARLISRGPQLLKRGIAQMRLGGNPDFTYPPTIAVVTVTPAPSGTTVRTVSITSTVTDTSTSQPSGATTRTTQIDTTTTQTVVAPSFTTTTSDLSTDKFTTTTRSTTGFVAITTVSRVRTLSSTITSRVTVTTAGGCTA
ncbi:putative PAN/Apple domain-containing protein [Septoria linicola]|nr:putative PAN/Apple domain-containing protein [Septoria linicola]